MELVRPNAQSGQHLPLQEHNFGLAESSLVLEARDVRVCTNVQQRVLQVLCTLARKMGVGLCFQRHGYTHHLYTIEADKNIVEMQTVFSQIIVGQELK